MLKEKMIKAASAILAGVTMAICITSSVPAISVEAAVQQESEPNNTPAEANQLSLNTWMKGVSQVSRDEDWYQLTIPQQGASQLELGQGEDNPYSHAAWKVKL